MKITKLEPLESGGFRLCFEDGKTVKTTAEVVADFGLHSGSLLDEDEFQTLNNKITEIRARQKAAEMVGRRPLSKKELCKKLKEKGEIPEIAEAAAQWMEDRGYIDDARYAELLVRRYEAKGCGAARIKNELYAHGVPREYWDEALEALTDPSDRIDKFIMSRLKGETPDRKELKRVTDALYRKGYGWDDIRAGLSRYGEETEMDD